MKELPANFKNLRPIFDRLPEEKKVRILRVLEEYKITDREITAEEVEQVRGMITRIIAEGIKK